MSNGTVPHYKFQTELTDYSVTHEGNTGPYASDLDIDALVIGAGFGKFQDQPNIPLEKGTDITL